MQAPLSDAAADIAACRALLRHGSRTFWAAGLLLPPAVRAPASALYAFCRLADDAVDLGPALGRAASLERLRVRLARVYDGMPADGAADRAFAAVVRDYAIPRTLPEALLEGLAWDAEGRRYADLPALLDYAARVAGAVGAMMAVVMDVRAPDALARACDLGVAMQLSNIVRDVGEDARAGRLYLPLDWLAEAGIDASGFVADPRPGPALAAVLRRLLGEADRLYARARPGIGCLPRRCRPGIRAAAHLYAAIGHEVGRRGHDSITARAVVPAGRKARLVLRSLRPDAARPGAAPPLEATRFLVDAVSAAPVPRRPAPPRNLGEQIVWLAELFDRLEQREQPQGEPAR